ncbi:MAG: MarR family transcriptional regulator, partial [Phenylobacterium sp.]|nr:MarR family transcriptional regulator [Phenylobacterium sp.]
MSRKPSPSEASVSHLLHRAVQIAADLHAEQAGPEGL